jgi:Uma2 family endonuclease
MAIDIWAEENAMTVADFDAYALLPENAERLLEFVAGEINEVPSNPYASKVGSLILAALLWWVTPRNLGHVTGEAGGYMVSGERYAPDVAFISKARQPEIAKEGYNPNAPDIAVEVDFPSTYASQQKLRFKTANYLAAGTLLWVVRPETKTVEVYAPGKPVRLLTIRDILDGDDVLPGFTMAVKDIFAS